MDSRRPSLTLSTRKALISGWEAMRSIASKIGCTAETLRKWVRKAEVDTGRWDGVTSDERSRMKELEREVRQRT
mgnify:CR=1 FL=1